MWFVPNEDRIQAKTHKSRRGKDVDLVVIHYTVTPFESDPRREVDRLRRWASEGKASTHFAICRDGRTIQLVDTDRLAEHTSDSLASWDGEGNGAVDRRSIGIDLVNAGWLKDTEDGRVANAYNRIHKGEVWRDEKGRPWDRYTEAQIASLRCLVEQLVYEYPVLSDPDRWVGHSEIQSNKDDPGPCLPMDDLKGWVIAAGGGYCGED